MNRLLLLIRCLSIGADLWIYVESGDTDCRASRQVTQALVTPIEELAAERPNTQAIRDYLSELHQAREDLHAAGTVTLQTRDECRLHWSHPCPSWALSERAVPKRINEDAYLHPVLIVRHLEYVMRLADMNRDDYRGTSHRLSESQCWLRWTKGMRLETADGHEQLCVARPNVMPVPKPSIQWPWRLHVWTGYVDVKGKPREYTNLRIGGASEDEVLRAIDAGTGILCGRESE